MESWIAQVVGEMHVKRITGKELASHMGVTAEYVSIILNGKRSPKGAEEKLRKAMKEIEEKRKLSEGSESPLT